MAILEEHKRAIQHLKEGIAFHDHFGPQTDDCAILVEGDDFTLYELAFVNSEGRLSLGDLRDILLFCERAYDA